MRTEQALSFVIALFLHVGAGAAVGTPQDNELHQIGDGYISATGGPTLGPEQTLSTVVQDPDHPLEPWEVTTYRKPDESPTRFIRRHREMVDAVRDAL